MSHAPAVRARLRVAVLVSGRGTNLQALLDAQGADFEVVLVCSNRADIPALERARRARVERRAFPGKSRQEEMARAIRAARADLVVLAGFDQVLAPAFFARLGPAPIISTHPSLLPKFGGKGMIGRAVHEAVLAAGERETGCTVFRTRRDTLDEGEILARRRVPVRPDDTPETLEARVLAEEHKALVDVVRSFAVRA